MPEIKFIPQNEEEEKWKVVSYIHDKAIMDETPTHMFFYTNSQVRMSRFTYERLVPIKNPTKVYARCIIYAMRHFNDKRLTQKIPVAELWMFASSEMKRTRRAILKFWSERPHETNREDFEEHFQFVNTWKPKSFFTFLTYMKTLMAYRILDIEKRFTGKGYKIHVKFTDLGRAIIRLHRDHNFIF